MNITNRKGLRDTKKKLVVTGGGGKIRKDIKRYKPLGIK